MAPGTTEPEYLKKPEVCRRLSISARTLDRLIADGELPVIRHNARVTRIAAAEVDAYIARRAA